MTNFGSGENMEDLISRMPDDILVSIIARCPTKEALSTSILSKRWRYLFRFVPAFDFSWSRDFSTCPIKKSIEGVYGVLQRHRAFIRSFKFCWRLTEPYSHTFEQCIYLLGELGIKKLSFEPVNHQVSFSFHLLSQMPSLENLALSLCSLQPNLSIICNSLKTLKLSNVKAPPGSLECILSNCVSLCSFTIINCKFSSKLCFRGPNLQLKCIRIRDCYGFDEIELFASNLTTLEFCCFKLVAFTFDYVPRLESVYLHSYEATPFVCTRLGNDLPHLKTLVWDISGDPFFKEEGIAMPINMSKLNNLKRLEVSDTYLVTLNLFPLTTLLHGCPLLEEFRLSVTCKFYLWTGEEKEVALHSHLKNVELNGFGGTENEIKFASYILRSAVKLQLVTISWYPCGYLGFGEWVEIDYPSMDSGVYPFNKVNQSIEQLKQEAISKTAQVTFQKFPQRVPKQF